MSRNILIMGAAGRDFHVFNCRYRDWTDVEVVAFTAAQIPNIEDRRYPTVLAGQTKATSGPMSWPRRYSEWRPAAIKLYS